MQKTYCEFCGGGPECAVCGRGRPDPFVVTVFAGEGPEKVCENLSYHGMRKTLRLAWELAGGLPSAWVGIRRRGVLMADLETDWRGELKEANVYAERRPGGCAYPVVKVTGLNPRGPIFAGVFAG